MTTFEINVLDLNILGSMRVTPYIEKVIINKWNMENIEGLEGIIAKFPQLKVMVVEDSSNIEYVNCNNLLKVNEQFLVFKKSKISALINRTDDIESKFKRIKTMEDCKVIENSFSGKFSSVVFIGNTKVTSEDYKDNSITIFNLKDYKKDTTKEKNKVKTKKVDTKVNNKVGK